MSLYFIYAPNLHSAIGIDTRHTHTVLVPACCNHHIILLAGSLCVLTRSPSQASCQETYHNYDRVATWTVRDRQNGRSFISRVQAGQRTRIMPHY